MTPGARALAGLALATLGCAGPDAWVDLCVAASTDGAVHDVLRTHPAVVRSGVPVITNANASSTLARQILDGAPADVFLAADPAWADAVAAERPVLARVDLLTNRIVAVANPDAARACTALGDPDHVPAGRYARTGLEAEGRWPPPDPVPFPTGPAAAWAVANGDCAHGYVYASDAQAVGLAAGEALEVEAVYPLLLLHERGRWVFDALQSAPARAAFAERGFGTPP